MNNNLFARELKQRFPDQIIVAQAGPYQDVLIVCYDSLYFSDAFRDLLTARSARLVNWTRDLQPLGHDTDHCMQMTIAPKHREYWAQDRRRQISLKLSPESDAVLLEYLDHVDNIQGLIKSLLMDLISHKLFQEGGKQIMEEMRHWFLNGETHAIYPEDIPEELDSKDSSEEDDEWDFYYEDDAELEVGFDPYLGCYTDDC